METKFVQGSFKDFRGFEHKFVIAGVIKSFDDTEENKSILLINRDDYIGSYSGPSVYKVLSIGISICNPGNGTTEYPGDTFSEKRGKLQAEGRANKYMDRLVSFTKGGMLSEDVVDFFLTQTANNLVKNPGLFIKGYNAAAKKYIQSAS